MNQDLKSALDTFRDALYSMPEKEFAETYRKPLPIDEEPTESEELLMDALDHVHEATSAEARHVSFSYVAGSKTLCDGVTITDGRGYVIVDETFDPPIDLAASAKEVINGLL